MPNSFTPQQIEQFLREFFDVVGARQYIGARYVPIFGRRGEDTVEWDDGAPYEPLTVVMHLGVSYVSRQYVPTGTPITDTDFWVETYRYNAQVEQYRQEVLGFQGQIDQIREDMESDYVPFPDSVTYPKYGTMGQVLTTLANGETMWEDPVVPSDEQAEEVITQWLAAHPEATTTVQDGAITVPKINGDANILSYKGVLSGLTSLASVVKGGLYSCPGVLVPNLTDCPSNGSGMLLVMPQSQDGSATNIIQVYIDGNANGVYVRKKSGNTQYEWNKLAIASDFSRAMVYRRPVVAGDSALSSIVATGYYNIPTSVVSSLSDAPSANGGALFVYANIRTGENAILLQEYFDATTYTTYQRQIVGSTVEPWVVDPKSFRYRRPVVAGDSALSSIVTTGYYNIPTSVVSSLSDAPSDLGGALFVYANIRTGGNDIILQEYFDNDYNTYQRQIVGSTVENWVPLLRDTKTLKYRRSVKANDGSLSAIRGTGYYNIPQPVTASLDDSPSSLGGALIVMTNVRGGNDDTITQTYLDSDNNIYMRQVVDSEVGAWQQINGGAKPLQHNRNVTVISDSIAYGYYDDNGTLDVDQTRCWPTLLSKYDYNVKNVAIGGMGYLDPASTAQQETYMDVIRATDFTDCDCFIISGGINDYKGLQPLGSTTDTGETTVLGVVNTIISYMATNYPSCRLIFTSPYNSSIFGTEATKWGIDYTNAATVGYTLKEMSDGIKSICDANGITYIDLMTTNCFNYKTINTILTDKVHPSHDGQWALAGFTVAKVLAELRGVA